MATETYQLAISGLAGNEYVENILHFISSTADTNDTIGTGTSLINSWHTNIKNLWMATLPSSYSLERLAARRVIIKPSATPHKQYEFGTEFGSLGTDQTGDQVCPSVFLIPPMGTKSGGRVFMPAVGQAQIANSTFAAGYITAINSLFAAMTANFGVSGAQWQLAIYSRKLNQSHLALSWTLSPVIGFQSRRRVPI